MVSSKEVEQQAALQQNQARAIAIAAANQQGIGSTTAITNSEALRQETQRQKNLNQSAVTATTPTAIDEIKASLPKFAQIGGQLKYGEHTRFSMALPASYARKHGLMPQGGDAPYAIDLRVEYIKTFDSFCFTCRLLDQQRTPGLDDLNLPSVLLRAIKEASNEPSGLILASGPTGSGKTTLLNAVLGYLNDGQRSIVTIENPVEFRLKGPGPIKQLQVQGDFTFARALRSTLRADPDVILVGEIRDEETMKIAIEASKTGHLVLATVHANDGHGTISRLVELGADPMNIADSLKLVMAQRILTSYSGEKKLRPLTRDESDWMSINGMGGNPFIAESVSGEKIGMVPIDQHVAFLDLKVIARHATDSLKNVFLFDVTERACGLPKQQIALINFGWFLLHKQ